LRLLRWPVEFTPGAGSEDRDGDRLGGAQAILAHAGAAIE
jgi:hypothetical protein